MLTYEELLNFAQKRNIPASKMRGIAREYLQVLILRSIYADPEGKNFYFMGGTALRFFYNLPRFSEDLDFNGKNITFEDFKEILKRVEKHLALLGFQSESSAKESGTLLQGKIKVVNILQAYRIPAMRDEKLMVKVELNRPKFKMPTETRVLSAYGEMFPVILMESGVMFAEKIAALLNRKLGRDIYDTFFMLGNKFSVDENVLRSRNIESDYRQIVSERIKSFSEKELKEFASKLEPFLFDPNQTKLVADASKYIDQFIKEYGKAT